jgi:AraC-like DNA-binding protein
LISADKDGETHTRLENLLMEMYAEYQQKNVGYRLSIKSKLYELATLLLREVPADWSYYMGVQKWKSSNNNLCLEHILSFIFDNFDDSELTLEKAADAIGLSKFHLTRFLKEHTGQGFHEYLCRMRVRSAEKYLAESDVPVTDIAYQCGFSSLSTFNRLFKSYTSLSPSTYRIGKA